MGPVDVSLHVLFIVYFSVLLFMSIHQLLVESCQRKDFIAYRLFLVLSVMNEIIILSFLFNDQTTTITLVIRMLILGNLMWGSYILYKLGKMGADGLYKQMTANKERSPPWFVMYWRVNCLSNAVVLLGCMIAGFATNRLRPMEFYSVYLDGLIVVSSTTFIAILCKVRYNLHMVEARLKHQVSTSFGQDTDDEHQKQLQRGNTIDQNQLKKLRLITKTRMRMDVAMFLIILIIPGTLFGTVATIEDIVETDINKFKMTDPVYAKPSTFLSHFIFALLYETICFLWLYRNSKFCSHFAEDSCYNIVCIKRLHCPEMTKFSAAMNAAWDRVFPSAITRASSKLDPSHLAVATDPGATDTETDTPSKPITRALAPGGASAATSSNHEVNLELAKKELEAMAGLQVTDLDGLLAAAPEETLDSDRPDTGSYAYNPPTAPAAGGGGSRRSGAYESEGAAMTGDEDESGTSSGMVGNGGTRKKVPSQTVDSTISGMVSNSGKVDNMHTITESAEKAGVNEDDHLERLTARRDTEETGQEAELGVLPLKYNNSDAMAFNAEVRLAGADIPSDLDGKRPQPLSMKSIEIMGDGESPKERSAPGTPTQRQPSQTDRSFFDNELSSRKKKIDLNKIDYYGNEKGKRDKKKVKKMKKARREEIKKGMEKRPIAEESKHQFSQKLMTRYKTHDPHNEPTAFSIPDGLPHLEQKSDNNDDLGNKMKRPPVSLVIYEFEHTLSTLPHKIREKTSEDIEEMDLSSIVFLFGGEQRLEELHEHLSEVFVRQKGGNMAPSTRDVFKQQQKQMAQQGIQQPMCFVLTNEFSETVFKALERVRLVEYFVSVNPNAAPGRKVKKLSHVIGYDHKLMKETERKKYLIILKLIQFLRRDHDSVLYIGHDKEVIDQLKAIRVCRTFYVETKGMTKKDFDTVEQKHF